jgi:hypothetical protein
MERHGRGRQRGTSRSLLAISYDRDYRTILIIDLQPYNEKHAEDKERYEREKETYDVSATL